MHQYFQSRPEEFLEPAFERYILRCAEALQSPSTSRYATLKFEIDHLYGHSSLDAW